MYHLPHGLYYRSLQINETLQFVIYRSSVLNTNKEKRAINGFHDFFLQCVAMRSDVTAIKLISSLSFIGQFGIKQKKHKETQFDYKMQLIPGSQVKCHSS